VRPVGVSRGGDGQEPPTLSSGVPVSELVAPLVVLAVLLLAGAVAVLLVVRRRRAVRSSGGPAPRRAARAARPRPDRGTALARPEQLGIRTLTTAERERYLTAWEGLQSRAERLPALSLCEADAVVDRLLRDCGYPVDDPRAPGDVVPGRHAEVLASFRAGHALEQINSTSRSDAEQVRQAMSHFQAAFDAVVAQGTPAFPDAPRMLSADPSSTPRPHPGR
jgi:hypothetical protein